MNYNPYTWDNYLLTAQDVGSGLLVMLAYIKLHLKLHTLMNFLRARAIAQVDRILARMFHTKQEKY